MGSIIASHNTKALASTPNPEAPTCNCQQPQDCPLKGKCQIACIVYKATVSAPNNPTKFYYGLTEKDFKTRYRNHTSSFRNPTYRNNTELSKHVWTLKESGLEPKIKWEIIRRAAPYKCGARRCDLCLTEKMIIAAANPHTTLNKRSELVSTCRHRAKFRCSKVPRLTPPRWHRPLNHTDTCTYACPLFHM